MEERCCRHWSKKSLGFFSVVLKTGFQNFPNNSSIHLLLTDFSDNPVSSNTTTFPVTTPGDESFTYKHNCTINKAESFSCSLSSAGFFVCSGDHAFLKVKTTAGFEAFQEYYQGTYLVGK